MRNLKLRPELVRLLRRIEDNGLGTSLHGLSHESARRTLEPEFRDILNNAGLTRTQYIPGQAFSRELVRVFRSKAGKELVDSLRDALRRWDAYGLKLSVLEDMVLTVLGKYLGTKPDSWQVASKPRKRRKGTYEDALRQGRARRRAASTIEEQAAAHRKMAGISREISDKVREVLDRHGVLMNELVRYNAFAYKVGAIARKRTKQTLRRMVLDRVDQYEAKGLDRAVLLDISKELAGVED
jgi:hypothetical protein